MGTLRPCTSRVALITALHPCKLWLLEDKFTGILDTFRDVALEDTKACHIRPNLFQQGARGMYVRVLIYAP